MDAYTCLNFQILLPLFEQLYQEISGRGKNKSYLHYVNLSLALVIINYPACAF
jgi:hypothetical protein